MCLTTWLNPTMLFLVKWIRLYVCNGLDFCTTVKLTFRIFKVNSFFDFTTLLKGKSIVLNICMNLKFLPLSFFFIYLSILIVMFSSLVNFVMPSQVHNLIEKDTVKINTIFPIVSNIVISLKQNFVFEKLYCCFMIYVNPP